MRSHCRADGRTPNSTCSVMEATPTAAARRVSGAPTWPNATVNKAVATRMGSTRVTFCTAPGRLNVDGNSVEIADGQVMSLPTGVDIRRTGNTYVAIDQNGNSLRAEIQDTH